MSDWRPGHQAAKEVGVRESACTKPACPRPNREGGGAPWASELEQAAAACLSSRIPLWHPRHCRPALARIEAAESRPAGRRACASTGSATTIPWRASRSLATSGRVSWLQGVRGSGDPGHQSRGLLVRHARSFKASAPAAWNEMLKEVVDLSGSRRTTPLHPEARRAMERF